MPFIVFLWGLVTLLSFSGCAIASGRLAYMREWEGQKQIYLKTAEGAPQPVTFGKEWHLYPALDSRGKQLAYVQGLGPSQLNILLMDLATGKVTALTRGKGQRLHPSFSADGKFLAYATTDLSKDDVSKVVVLKLSDPNRPISQTIQWEVPAFFPSLSSQGDFLVVQLSFPDGTKRLLKRDLNSKKEQWLTDIGRISKHPSLSPDDKKVLFSAKDGNAWNVFLLNLSSKEERQLTQEKSSYNLAPVWRQDGSVVFASDRSGHFELFEIAAEKIKDGTFEAKLLVSDGADLYAPTTGSSPGITQGLLSPIPEPARSSFAATSVGQKLYVIGGHQGHEHTYPPESFLSRLESYDLANGTWERLPDRSTAAHGFGVVSHGNYLYVFGGFASAKDKNPPWQSLDNVDRYDTEKKTWKTVAHLPRRRSSYIVQKIGSKAYLIGGWDSTPRFDKDYDGVFQQQIDVFDCDTETVTANVASLPEPLRRAFTSVVWKDEILLVGGIGQGASHFDLLAQVTAFNPEKNTWRELPPLPFATFAPATGVLGEKVYVFGGMRKVNEKDYEYVDNIFVFDGEKWKDTGRKLHETKGFSQVVALPSGSLAILGGHSANDDEDAPVSTAEVFAD